MKRLIVMLACCAAAVVLAAEDGKAEKEAPAQPADAVKGAARPEGEVPSKTKPADSTKVVEAQKDDGRCWAVTDAGTRCKRRKISESDYCRQHSPDVKPSKPVKQCRAMTYEGTQCIRKPVEGSRYCKQHGGRPPAEK